MGLLLSIIGGLLWFGRAVATGRINVNSRGFRAGYQVLTVIVAISIGWDTVKSPRLGHVPMFAGWGLTTVGYWSEGPMRLAKPLGELSMPPPSRADRRLANLGSVLFFVGLVCLLARV